MKEVSHSFPVFSNKKDIKLDTSVLIICSLRESSMLSLLVIGDIYYLCRFGGPSSYNGLVVGTLSSQFGPDPNSIEVNGKIAIYCSGL